MKNILLNIIRNEYRETRYQNIYEIFKRLN